MSRTTIHQWLNPGRRRQKRMPVSSRKGLSRQLRVEPLEERRVLASFVVDLAIDEDDGDLSAGDVSLREALSLANNNPGPDTITFAQTNSGQTLFLTGAALPIDEEVAIDATSLNTTFTIDAQGLTRVFEIGAAAGNVSLSGLAITNGRAPSGLSDGENGDDGGAIRSISNGTLTLSSVSISSSSAGHGYSTPRYSYVSADGGNGGSGGAVFAAGDVVITGSTISGNQAGEGGSPASYLFGFGGVGGDGGAVFSTGNLTVSTSTITGNNAGDGGRNADSFGSTSGGDGGGIFAAGTVQVTDSTVSGNEAGAGGNGAYAGDGGSGGAVHSIGLLTVTRSTIDGNSSGDGGERQDSLGGVRGGNAGHGGGLYASAGLVLIDSTVSGNRTGDGGDASGAADSGDAGNGGGVHVAGALEITQSTISGNATGDGGNLRNYTYGYGYDYQAGDGGSGGGVHATGQATVRQSTITGNSVGLRGTYFSGYGSDGMDGDGSGVVLTNAGAAHLIEGSIIAGNSTTANAKNLAASSVAGDFNLLGPGDIVGGVNDIVVANNDPLLAPLADNGGPTATHALLASSPAIDSGDGGVASLPGPFDQRGVGFDRIQGDVVDRGAFESASITVNALGDVDDGDPFNGSTTLREAVFLANTTAGDATIRFAESLAGQTISLSSELLITDGVEIVSPNTVAGVVTIDAGGTHRIFNIDDLASTDETFSVVIDDLIITGGRTTEPNIFVAGEGFETTNSGGAIRFLSAGSLTLNRVVVTGSGTLGDRADGGAIYSSSGVVRLSGTTVSNNSTQGRGSDGGGIFAGGGLVTTGPGVVIENNETAGDFSAGGGVYALSGGISLDKATLVNNSTLGDQSFGGAIATSSGNISLTETLVSGNTTAGDHAWAGGLFSNDGEISVTRSTLSGNSTSGSGAYGGAIRSSFGSITIIGSTVSGNSTTGSNASGGAIHTSLGHVNASQSTIVENSAQGAGSAGGGIAVLGGSLTLNGTALAKNTAAGGNADISATAGVTEAITYSLVGDAEGTTLGVGSVGGTAAVPLDPKLGPLANNGGPLFTHHPLPASPLIDAGDPTLSSAIGDQRGTAFPRVTDGDTDLVDRVDIGSVEALGLVNPSFENSGGSQSPWVLVNSGSLSTAAATDGANSFSLSNNGQGFSVLLQNVPIRGGETLFASGSYLVRSSDTRDPAAFGELKIEYYDVFGGAFGSSNFLGETVSRTFDASTPLDEWLTTDVIAKAPDDAVEARIVATYVGISPGTVYYDAMRVREAIVVDSPSDTEIAGDNETTLREAFGLSNMAPGRDAIVFDDILSGQTISLAGTQLTSSDVVLIEGTTLDNPVIVDAQNNSRVIEFTGAGISTLRGLELANGSAATGGAVLSSVPLVIENSTIRDSVSTGSYGHGGGIRSTADLTITGSVISGNAATGFVGRGGGVQSEGLLTITNSTISGNSTGGRYAVGGGISIEGPSATIIGSTVSENTTTDFAAYGGGLFISPATNGGTTIIRSTFSGNSVNSTGNQAIGARNDLTLRETTVFANDAAGIGNSIRLLNGASLVLDQSIVSGNTAVDISSSGGGTIYASYSLISNSGSETIVASGGSQNFIGEPGTEIAALLGPLADNGGLTQTHLPLLGSPALNGGDPIAAGGTGLFDQRGAGFPRVALGRQDIGAAEAVLSAPQQGLIVSTTSDAVDENFSQGELSLREALLLAEILPGADTITFDAAIFGTHQTIAIASELPTITEDLIITGPAANLLTIDAGQNSRHFSINDGDEQTQINVTLSDMTLSGGLATNNMGGGAINSRENLTLVRSHITGNETSGSAFGGGLFAGGEGLLTVRDSTISGNTSYSGGALINYTTGSGAVVVENSTLSGNTATDFAGGAIFNQGALTLRGTTVTGNQDLTELSAGAFEGGGGVYSRGNVPLTIENTIIVGNTRATAGGTVQDDFRNGDPSGGSNSGAVTASFSVLGETNGPGPLDGVDGNQVGVTDAVLGPLQDNGGPTPTHALLAGSPAIDSGNPLVAFDPAVFDQRGVTFERVQFGRIDAGAFEVQDILPPQGLVVSTTSDVFDGDFSVGQLSLREATELANLSQGSDTITFDSTLFASQKTILLDDELLLSDNTTITGPGGGLVVVDGQAASRVLRIDNGDDGVLTTVAVSGITIANGATSFVDSSVEPGRGGAIRNTEDLTLDDVTFTSNTAAAGGAVWSRFGTLSIANSTFSGNTGTNKGGALYLRDSTVTLANSVITGNSSNRGGGIYTSNVTLGIERSTLTSNLATLGSPGTRDGGAIYSKGTTTITESTLSGNAVGNHGAAVFNRQGVLTVERSTLNGGIAGLGGGIFAFAGTSTNIYSSTISGNDASIGAGIYNDGVLKVANSTITLNSTNTFPAAAGISNGISGGSATLRDTIVSGNADTSGPNNLGGGAFTGDFNLFGTGDLVAGVSNITTDSPGLAPLANNGGPTQTHAFLPLSPALDAGSYRLLDNFEFDLFAFNYNFIDLFSAADNNPTVINGQAQVNVGSGTGAHIWNGGETLSAVGEFVSVDFGFNYPITSFTGFGTSGVSISFFSTPSGGLLDEVGIGSAFSTPTNLSFTSTGGSTALSAVPTGILSFVAEVTAATPTSLTLRYTLSGGGIAEIVQTTTLPVAKVYFGPSAFNVEGDGAVHDNLIYGFVGDLPEFDQRGLGFDRLGFGGSGTYLDIGAYEAPIPPGSSALEVIEGDFNGDGMVDNSDLNLLLTNWSSSNLSPDGWDGDKPTGPTIDNDELNRLLSNWGMLSSGNPQLAQTTPETPQLTDSALDIAFAVFEHDRPSSESVFKAPVNVTPPSATASEPSLLLFDQEPELDAENNSPKVRQAKISEETARHRRVGKLHSIVKVWGQR